MAFQEGQKSDRRRERINSGLRGGGRHNKQRYILTGWEKEGARGEEGRFGFMGGPWYRDFHDVIALCARQVNYSPTYHMTKAPQGAVQNAV